MDGFSAGLVDENNVYEVLLRLGRKSVNCYVLVGNFNYRSIRHFIVNFNA